MMKQYDLTNCKEETVDDLIAKLGPGTYRITVTHKEIAPGVFGSDMVLEKDGVVLPNTIAVVVKATIDDSYPTIKIIELTGMVEINAD